MPDFTVLLYLVFSFILYIGIQFLSFKRLIAQSTEAITTVKRLDNMAVQHENLCKKVAQVAI